MNLEFCQSTSKILSKAKILFWDFDGVIKDSVSVKTEAFIELFSIFGKDVVDRVSDHQQKNGGLSRFEKIPLYLEWSGHSFTSQDIIEWSNKFSQLVFKGVIESSWVPGVREYLLANHKTQIMILVTATPQYEIEKILKIIGISEIFAEVYGSPISKASAMKGVLGERGITPLEALMVGDSKSDFEAASLCNIPFILRKTNENEFFRKRFNGYIFDSLTF